MMTSIARGLQPSFLWPGTGGSSASSAGESTLGNMRLAVAGNSAVTGGYGNGYMLMNEAHVSLHHIGSTWTGMLGHSRMIEHPDSVTTSLGSASSTRWLLQSGHTVLSSASSFGQMIVTFPIPYNSYPFIQVVDPVYFAGPFAYRTLCSYTTSDTSDGRRWTGFTSFYSLMNASGLGSTMTLAWFSDGTVNV